MVMFVDNEAEAGSRLGAGWGWSPLGLCAPPHCPVPGEALPQSCIMSGFSNHSH